MNKIIIVGIMLLLALSMGCIDQPVVEEPEEIIVEVPEVEQIVLEPAKLTIKSIKTDNEGIVFKIKNEGEMPATDIYFALIGVDYYPSFDEVLRWNYSITNEQCLEIINGSIRDKDFILDTNFTGRSVTREIPWDVNGKFNEYETLPGESLKLKTLLYKDYIDVIEPEVVIESNMYIFWGHDRFIKVLYDENFVIYEYTLYDDYDFRMDNYRSIIS